jgi:hypothetical protein
MAKNPNEAGTYYKEHDHKLDGYVRKSNPGGGTRAGGRSRASAAHLRRKYRLPLRSSAEWEVLTVRNCGLSY